MPPLSRRCWSGVAHEDDLAYDSSLREQLLRAPCVGEGESVRNERLDPLLLKQFEQRKQVLPKQGRFETLERLNAVGDDPLPPGEKPAAGDVHRVHGDAMKPIATACTIRTQSLPT